MANGQDRILDCAAGLFLQYGYKHTTMESIASAIGLSKASLYLHFQNKEAIFRAFADRELSKIIEFMRGVAAKPLPPRQKLREMLVETLLHLWDFCHQAPHAPALWAEILLAARDQTKRGYELSAELLAAVVAEGQAVGEFDPQFDPRQVAEMLQLAVRGLDAPYTHVHARAEIEAQAPKLLDFIMTGLARRSPAAPSTV